ncbi:unnamed protein product [Orchesella dallaii]|uniref:Homeobox domain-containing protein n=1 Tax=Orchesella dallaii TaxID=48710 RepID=A0ABP1RGY6_9HEXA
MASGQTNQDKSQQRLQETLERVKKKVVPLKRTIVLYNPFDDSDSMDDSPPPSPKRTSYRNRRKGFYELEEKFETNPNPSNSDIFKITYETGLTRVQIKRWFQRRRKKISVAESTLKVSTPPTLQPSDSRRRSDSGTQKQNVVALRSNLVGHSIPIVVGNRVESQPLTSIQCYSPPPPLQFDSWKPKLPEAITVIYEGPPPPARREASHTSLNVIRTSTVVTLERFKGLLNSDDWDDATSRLLALATSNIPLAAVVLKESKLLKEDVLPSWFTLDFSQQLQIIQWKENYLMKFQSNSDNVVRGVRVVLESVVIPWIAVFIYGKLVPDEEKGMTRALRDACKVINNQALREYKWQVPSLIDQ